LVEVGGEREGDAKVTDGRAVARDGSGQLSGDVGLPGVGERDRKGEVGADRRGPHGTGVTRQLISGGTTRTSAARRPSGA
jgi:hypothetical protein